MTRRRSRRPRKPRTIVEDVAPEEEEILDEEEELEEDEDEEEEKEAPPPRRRRRKKAAPSPEPEDAEEEAPPTRRRRRQVTVPDTTPEDKIGQATGAELMDIVLNLVDEGMSITIHKVAGKYLLHGAGQTPKTLLTKSKAMTRKEFENIAYSDEFKKFHPEWAKYTYEEKVEVADEEEIVWERHENPKVDVMRLTAAVRASRGIEKWKPEYDNRQARKDLLDDGILADDPIVDD